MFEKDFCKLAFDNEKNMAIVDMTLSNFVEAMEKASQAVTSAIKGGTDIEDMYVAMTFAEALPQGYDFATAGDVPQNLENNLPQIRVNGNRTALQYLCSGNAFNDGWYDLADNLRKTSDFIETGDINKIQLIFDANENEASIILT